MHPHPRLATTMTSCWGGRQTIRTMSAVPLHPRPATTALSPPRPTHPACTLQTSPTMRLLPRGMNKTRKAPWPPQTPPASPLPPVEHTQALLPRPTSSTTPTQSPPASPQAGRAPHPGPSRASHLLPRRLAWTWARICKAMACPRAVMGGPATKLFTTGRAWWCRIAVEQASPGLCAVQSLGGSCASLAGTGAAGRSWRWQALRNCRKPAA
mmetsp:Transcript_11810/g.32184  ORF Transcript_11810/g.32184 Transcript_11810/m.32184 type:complete len:211 (-) Transcript_11810:359-991(-)